MAPSWSQAAQISHAESLPDESRALSICRQFLKERALEAGGWTVDHPVPFVRPILSHFLSGQTHFLSANSCNTFSVKYLVTPGDIVATSLTAGPVCT
jgi:hypothetical protein